MDARAALTQRRLLTAALALTLAAFVAAAAPGPARALQNGLARTPPMGWNSWYPFHCAVTEQDVLENAQVLVASGMAAAGYRYVNVDACWEAKHRDGHGHLQANPRTFPDGMAALGLKLHAMGLKFGLYTSAGSHLCDIALPGSFRHYNQDLRTFASWGVDYLKVDWCSKLPRGSKPQKVYAAIARAARHAGRRMITTVSTPGVDKPWRWAARDGNSWRIAPDLTGSWPSILRVLGADAPLWPFAAPGAWNDADILQVGNGRLTDEQERAQISLWSVLASPLLAGNDLRLMTPALLATLTNPDVVAVDQDPAGRQGRRVSTHQGHEVWMRSLADGSSAILVLNRTGTTASVSVKLASLPGVRKAEQYEVRDLWSHVETTSTGLLTLPVPATGVVMLRVRAA